MSAEGVPDQAHGVAGARQGRGDEVPVGGTQAPVREQPGQDGAGGFGLPEPERVQFRLVLSLEPAFAVPARLAVTDEEEAARPARRLGGAQWPPSLTAMSGAAGFFMPTMW